VALSLYYTSRMAMGKRERQPSIWVATTDFPTAAGHPFYTRLNQLLRDKGYHSFRLRASGGVAGF